MRIDRRLLGWGLFLIIAGAIPLLVRSGYLAADTIRPWPSLWPIILIGSGLGLLLRRTPVAAIGSAVTAIVFGVMAGGLIATGFGGVPAFGACGDGSGGAAFSEHTGTLGDHADVSLELNCGTFAVAAVDGSDWSVAGTGPQGRSPDIDASDGRLRITPPDDDFMGFGEAGSAWTIHLPRTPSLDIGVTLNAGDGRVDLGGGNVDNVRATINAGSITFDLVTATTLTSVAGTVNAGSATFDLSGGVSNVDLTVNAGSVEVCLPSSAGLEIRWSGALGSNNFDDLDLVKVDDQHWQGQPLSTLDPAPNLDITANAGSFTLTLGGLCGA